MAPKKIVVFGVTGVQGGSVARALLQNPGEYEVWGVTRSKSSAKAKGEFLRRASMCTAAIYVRGRDACRSSPAGWWRRGVAD